MSKKKEDKIEQPPELDEEDEKILDNIWDQIGKEDKGGKEAPD